MSFFHLWIHTNKNKTKPQKGGSYNGFTYLKNKKLQVKLITGK